MAIPDKGFRVGTELFFTDDPRPLNLLIDDLAPSSLDPKSILDFFDFGADDAICNSVFKLRLYLRAYLRVCVVVAYVSVSSQEGLARVKRLHYNQQSSNDRRQTTQVGL